LFGYKYLDLLQQTKTIIMETTIKFSTDFLSRIDEVIFITFFGEGWERKWEILTDQNGKPFFNINSAKNFVRMQNRLGVEKFKVSGLSNLQQAQRGNAMWDNL
jgi:hypothetical protein